jgi:hypothetical protein
VVGEPGPLTRTVLDFTETMKRLVPTVRTATDWAPLTVFVALDKFQRVGVFREVQDWQKYTDMLTRWASGIDSFETSLLRVSELPDLVYYEVEERHHMTGGVRVVNSLTVFQFEPGAKIRHLDVYLQQAR